MTQTQQTQHVTETAYFPWLGWMAGYLASVFVCRLMLRCAGGALPGFMTMILEDGISILSFVMCLLYLWSTKGVPLAHVAKHFSSPEGVAEWQRALASADCLRNVRLFFLAM